MIRGPTIKDPYKEKEVDRYSYVTFSFALPTKSKQSKYPLELSRQIIDKDKEYDARTDVTTYL